MGRSKNTKRVRNNDEPPPLVPLNETEAAFYATLHRYPPSSSPAETAPPPPPRDYAPPPSESAPMNIDADITRSTLKWIVETAGDTLIYLLYVLGAWLVSVIVKRGSTYPFQALGWTLAWLGWFVERTLYWVVGVLANWLAWIAGGLLVAFLAVLVFAFVATMYEPTFHRFTEQHPRAYTLVCEGALHFSLVSTLYYRWLSRWIMWPITAFAAVRAGALLLGRDWTDALPFGRRKSRGISGTTSTTVAQARRELEEKIAERQRSKEEREPDNWARKMQEQMLRSSLARRARQAAGLGDSAESVVEEQHVVGLEPVD